MESFKDTINGILGGFATAQKEFVQGEDRTCEDCQQDKDNCPDCCDGDLYRAPGGYEVFGMER